MLSRKKVTAGATIEIRETELLFGKRERIRAQRCRTTSEAQEKVNRDLQLERARLWVNANCDKSWTHVSFGYSPENRPVSREDAIRDIGNAHRRFERFFRKQGVEYKYFAVTEVGKRGAWHHHIIMPHILRVDVAKVWGKCEMCGCDAKDLDDRGDYKDLAEYLIKKTDWEWEHREELKGKRRYSVSRNMKKPKVEYQRMRRKRVNVNPKPFKGYYIDPGSVYVGKNPFNGSEYVFYRMIKIKKE